jgi:predicted DsbA family dithiol-disulfide isomerase
MTKPKLSIDVVSDVVCPWCLIGKRRLEKAIALRPDIPVEVHWHPFFLNPWIPRTGLSRHDYLTKKFGSVDAYAAMAGRVKQAAADEGLTYASDRIARQPNTLDCHRLIRWAGPNADRMKQRLMDLYFAEGGDLTDIDVLVQAAGDCGLDGTTVRAKLASDEDVAAVEAQARHATELGISGVPCFIFGNALAVSGAQAPDDLAGAMDRAYRALLEQRSEMPA